MKTFTVEIQLEIDEEHPMIGSEGDIAAAVADIFEDMMFDDDYLNMVSLYVKGVAD